MDSSTCFQHQPFISTPDFGSPASAVSEPLSIQTDFAQASCYARTIPNDVPELYFDPGCSTTPPSAASSSMMPTPLYDWDTPLPEGSPPLMVPTKPSFDYSLDQWPLSTSDYQPYTESGLLSGMSHIQDPSTLDWLDELNWEKQRHAPELSSPYSRDGFYDPSKHASHSLLQVSTHSLSTTHDTHHKQAVQASSLSTSTYNNTVSPSMLSLSNNHMSSVPSTSVLPSPFHSATTAQAPAPLKLHQPRPSRRIPIISLAKLASASEELLLKKTAPLPDYKPKSPFPALSPLALNCHGFDPMSEQVQSLSKIYLPQYPPQNPLSNSAASIVFSRSGKKVITCSCGCKESYTIS